MLRLEVLWHPNLSTRQSEEVADLLDQCERGEVAVDILVIEGAICTKEGYDPVGRFVDARPVRERVPRLAERAQYVVAAGTCASFGGVMASGSNPSRAMGLQFLRDEFAGVLGKDFRSREGVPVVNIAGCPPHPDWITGTLSALASGKLDQRDLDRYNRPREFYSKLAHHACPRNEYYEFKASAVEYSQQGCLFENLGCKATQCESDCNERLWLARTGSCPRGGFPCLSCTSPRFPDGFTPFFRTEKIGDIPTALPLDVPKAWYIGISGLSKLACPERLSVNAVSFKRADMENKEESQ